MCHKEFYLPRMLSTGRTQSESCRPSSVNGLCEVEKIAMRTDFLLIDSGISLALCSQAPQNDVPAIQPSDSPTGLLESYTNPFPKQELTPETEGLKIASNSHGLHRGCRVYNTIPCSIPQDGKGPCKEGTSLAVQRGKTMSNVLFPTLGLSSHLCPGEVIHTLSPNCLSCPGPTALLWWLTIQPPLPSSKELQGAMFHLSACLPLQLLSVMASDTSKIPSTPKDNFLPK